MTTRDDLTADEQQQMRTLELVERNTATCKSCPASIIWAYTARNLKRIPLDATPLASPGSGQFTLRASGDRLVADYIDQHDQKMRRQSGEGGGYVSHFSTCPEAKKHRRSER